MTRKRGIPDDPAEAVRLFEAERAYAASIFQDMLGDSEGSVAAAERALEWKPDYAPALLAVGSIEYQRGREQEGARLFRTLLSLPDESGDLWEVIETAGDFLIQQQRYRQGLELFEGAVRRFPAQAALYQGVACCAGHEGLFDRSIEASRMALDLDPTRQELKNDLGWSLLSAGRLEEAEAMLLEAVDQDPSDELARENLRICRAELRSSGTSGRRRRSAPPG